MEKLLDELAEIEALIRKIEHMIYVTYPLIQEKQLLFKIIEDIKIAVTKLVSIILKYDASYKRVKLQQDPKGNLRVFIEKCAPRYSISRSQIKQILEILDIVKKHEDSSMEFKKQEKIVILSEYFPPKTITLEEVKGFLGLVKGIFDKAMKILNPDF